MAVRMHGSWVAAVLLLACTGLAAAAEAPARQPAESRLRLVESRVHASSAEGRFALTEASATLERAPVTANGRFRLIEVRLPTVGCDPQPDGVFANGFE